MGIDHIKEHEATLREPRTLGDCGVPRERDCDAAGVGAHEVYQSRKHLSPRVQAFLGFMQEKFSTAARPRM